MCHIKYSYFILILHIFDHISSKYVTRETVNGRIRGFVTKRTSHISVEQYLGVPYASPPVGHLRFEHPRMPKPWKDTLDVLKIPPACPQYLYYVNEHVPGFNRTSEDCLYLNVYVPQNTQKESLPVLLYVHGGGNREGMGAMFDGDVLAANGHIIIVTFNYRLGYLGFAAAKDEGLYGTYGLMDQLLAMSWVKNNIHNFGGNPDKVTIHGHSSGAVDVGLHLVSPLSKGFFRQAIIHSGSPLAPFAMARQEWKSGYNIDVDDIKSLCQEHDNRSLKLCLKSVPVENFTWLMPKIASSAVSFTAIVDGTFLTMRPEESLKAGKFNGESFLLSFTNAEWTESVYSKTIQLGLKHVMAFQPEYYFAKDLILKQYNLTDYKENQESLRQYTQVESDLFFVAPMIRMANMMVKCTSDVYVSSFDIPIHWHWDRSLPIDFGAPHGRDLFYIFGTPFVGHEIYNFTESDKSISGFMMKLYSNFVKHGFLTLDGKERYNKYSMSTKIVNSIRHDSDGGVVVKAIPDYKEQKMKFWNEYVLNISTENQPITCSSSSNSVYQNSFLQDLNSVIFLFIYVGLYFTEITGD